MDDHMNSRTPQDTPPPDAGAAGAPATGDGAGPKAPHIVISDRQLVHIVGDAWHAVHAANQPPQLYQRYGSLVRLHGGAQGLEIQAMDENAIYAMLARTAVWVKRSGKGRAANALPSREAARDMMAVPDPSLPVLEGLVTVPVLSRSGALPPQTLHTQHTRHTPPCHQSDPGARSGAARFPAEQGRPPCMRRGRRTTGTARGTENRRTLETAAARAAAPRRRRRAGGPSVRPSARSTFRASAGLLSNQS